MRVDAISIGNNPPDEVHVIIEVPAGGNPIKYELDKEAGALVVDRFVYTPMPYPGNSGFVPHKLSEDGDPIDVLVCNTRQLVAGKPGGHIHDLPHGCVTECAVREFRNKRRYRRGVVELILGDEDLGEQSGQRLGHRHGAMLAHLVEASRIALVNNLPLVDDETPSVSFAASDSFHVIVFELPRGRNARPSIATTLSS